MDISYDSGKLHVAQEAEGRVKETLVWTGLGSVHASRTRDARPGNSH